ncbi:hypothetical protein V6N12_066779 [Hibiscus sabdariffa]|uniref:Uncharacterized protein n=1 Tax=Hibiscus sabdariffa TaxID=183260 RepID=A0ABR2C972_9ROSI
MAENPKSLSGATMGMAADGSSLAVVDHDGGRPPDIILYTLHLELEKVKDQEEKLSSQKACANWILKGDRNTSFFHVSIMARRRRDFISCLKVNGIDWCDDQTALRIKLSSGVRSLLAVVSSRTPHEKILPRDRSDQLIIWATADILPLVTSADGGF